MNTSLIEFYDDNTERGTLFKSQLTKYVLIKKSIEFFGLLYLVFGIIFAYGWGCKILDIKVTSSQTFCFWEPICFMYSLVTFVICVMIVRSRIVKSRNNNININETETDNKSQPYSNRTMSLILVPLYLIAVIILSIISIRDFLIIPCNGNLTFLISFVTLLFLTASTILTTQTHTCPMVTNDLNLNEHDLNDMKKIKRYFKLWQCELYEMAIILFTTIGMINLFILNIIFQHVLTFLDVKNHKIFYIHYNYTGCFNNITGVSHKLTVILSTYNGKFRPLFLLYTISVIFFLIEPLITKFRFINHLEHLSLEYSEKYISEDVDDNDDEDDDSCNDGVYNHSAHNNENNEIEIDVDSKKGAIKLPSFKLPNLSLLVCITILSLCVFIFVPVYTSLRIKPLRYLINTVYVVFHLLVYAIGTWLSVVHLQEILTWPSFRNRSGKMIDHCLVWIGAAGQLLVGFGAMTNAVDLLTHKTPPHDWKMKLIRYLGIILSSCMVIQIYLQTVLLAIALERKWEKPKVDTWVERLCPAVGMMGLNLGLLLLSMVSISFSFLDRSDYFYSGLFISGCKFVGQTVGSVQRLHAALLFGYMIIYTHN